MKIIFTSLRILICAVLLSVEFPAISQNAATDKLSNPYNIPEKEWAVHLEKTEQLSANIDAQSFINYIVFSQDGDFKEMNQFLDFVNVKLKKDNQELVHRVGKGTITTTEEISKYYADLQPAYKDYYLEFKKVRAIPPELIRGPGTGSWPTPFNCGSPCTNPGFESGTGFWDYYTGTACISTTSDPCTINAAFSPTLHVIKSGPGFDPAVGPALPLVPPGGGTNTMMLGDGTGVGALAARASISFTVSAANANFTYRYACVMQDPQLGHTDPERPYFNVHLRDAAGNLITCGEYMVMAKPPMVGFTETAPGSTIWYRPWTTVFVPLNAYIGQCVTVQFTTSDCSQGGHYGYAYIDGDCDPLALITSSPVVCGGSSVTLTAPAGGAAYAWSNTAGGTAGIVGSTTGPTCIVNAAGTYQCIITSVSGPSCTTTLSIAIGANPSNPVASFTNTTVCTGAATAFTDTSTPVGSVDAWAWDFNNDGVTDDVTQNPVYTFAAAGTYQVTLIVSWGPCSGTTTQNVTVSSGFVPAITPAGPFCANAAPVTLVGTPAGGSWSGTGVTNTSAGTFDPAAATIGNNNLTYTVSGACGGSNTTTIVVNGLPVSNAGPDVNLCTGTSASLGTTATAGDTYSWTAATGLSSTVISDPTVALTNPGSSPLIVTYTVTTTAASGCSSTDQIDVTVGSLATADAGPAQTVCTGSSVTLAGTVGGSATTGTWGGGSGTYLPNNTVLNTLYTPSPAEEAAGSVTLTLVSNDPAGPCPVATATITITINLGATISAGPDQLICIGSAVTLAGSPGGSATAGTWSGGAGTFTPDAVTATAVYTPTAAEEIAGTVTLTYTSDDPAGPCPAATDQMIITINQQPTANAGSSQSVCAGTVITLAGSIGGSATSGIWSGGGGTFSPDANTLNAIYTPTAAECAAGSVILTLTTNDPAGPCTFSSSSVTHNFYPNPMIAFTVDDPDGCPVHCVQFTDQSIIATGSSIVAWIWDFGDSSSDLLQNPPHCYNNTGFYTVSLTAVSNNGCSSSLTIPNYIHVFPVPTAGFNPTPNPASVVNTIVTLNNTSSSDVNAWWYYFGDGDSISPNISSPIHIYPEIASSSYLATLIVQNIYGCYDTISHPVEIGPEFTFFIPNAFTPNGDGKNDFFFGQGIGIEEYDLWIFDRWGNMVFHGINLTDMWDGRANGGDHVAQQDVYVWKVSLIDVFRKKHNYMGTVTLVR